jgi:hypothetical protein
MSFPLLFLLLGVFTALGCGTEEPPVEDGGREDGTAPDAGLEIASPSPAALPTLTPCPAGWIEDTVADGPSYCRPWSDGPAPSCADHEARFVGTEGCTRIGSECPSDGWPEVAPTDALFVSAGAVDGTGTRADPFGTVSEAVEAASPGATVAIGVGDYEEEVEVDIDLTLLGACAEGVVLRSPASSIAAGVITISGGANVGVTSLSTGQSARMGIYVEDPGSAATISDVAVIEATAVGIYAELGARLEAERVAVKRTQTTSGILGRGASFETDATVTLRDVVIEGGSEQGIYVTGDGTTLTLEDASISDVAAVAAGRGSGVVVARGGLVEMRRVILHKLREGGVVVVDGGSRVVMEDSVIRDVEGVDLSPSLGRGINVQEGASFEGHRIFVESVSEMGVFVGVASASISDLVVSDVAVATDGYGGRGLSAQTGANTSAQRVFVTGAHEAGVAAFDSTVVATDLTVQDIRPSPRSGTGRAVSLQGGGSLTVERGRFARSIEIAIFAAGEGSSLAVSDVLVEDVESREGDGLFGRGVVAQSNAEVTLERVEARRVHDVGVMAIFDAQITARDLRILDVDWASCNDTSCGIIGPGGHALGLYAGSTGTIERFEIDRAALCGVQVDGGAAVTLVEGAIAHTEIGACVQSDAQDLGDLDGVRYVDNAQNLDATELPVPGAGDALGE